MLTVKFTPGEAFKLLKAASELSTVISNSKHRIAWVTQFGKSFSIFFFLSSSRMLKIYAFTKIAQVPGTQQFNHHFRMLFTTDVNDEVLYCMKLAYDDDAARDG